ncbi:lanthionine synthetase LanC family protein [Paenibacillus sp. FSL F4-0236]|uniref:lanthionine synthetase LanC family protein n=1 Tax=Paenibacillus sp. FSL F4-0236 TaxID=2954731 RepID=UPI0030F74600
MPLIKEKEIINVISDDDKNNLVNIFNAYFEDILHDESITFTESVTNNMLIGYAYNLLEYSDLWDEIIMKNMQIIRDEISKNKLGKEVFPDPNLVNTAYSIFFVWKNTNYFKKFVYSFNDYIVDLTNTYIQYFYENKKNIGYNFFSLSSGLSGIGNYLLGFEGEYQAVIEEILKILVFITDEETGNTSRITKQIDIFENHLDFGLRNGIGGFLLVMVKAYNNNIVIPGQKKAMHSIIHTYQQYVVYINNTTYWPGVLKLDSQIDLKDAGNTKETWAYGALAIGRILYLAGQSVQDNDLIDWASNIMQNKSRMFPNEFGVMNASLFNGYSGLLSIFDAIHRNDSSIEYCNMSNELLKKIINLCIKDPQPTFKLKNILLVSERITEVETFDDYTLGEGNTGIILSLVSTFSTAKQILHPYLGIS